MKEVCKEVINECDEHAKKIEEIKGTCETINSMIADAFKWLDVKQMSIEELYDLLLHNVDIKKWLR